MNDQIKAGKARVTQAVDALKAALQDLYAAGGQGDLKHFAVLSYSTEVNQGPAVGPWKYSSLGMACTCDACQLALTVNLALTMARFCADTGANAARDAAGSVH